MNFQIRCSLFDLRKILILLIISLSFNAYSGGHMTCSQAESRLQLFTSNLDELDRLYPTYDRHLAEYSKRRSAIESRIWNAKMDVSEICNASGGGSSGEGISGSSVLAMFPAVLFLLPILFIVYLAVKTFIEVYKTRKHRFKYYGHLEKVGIYDIEKVWHKYELFSTFDKDAFISISKYLGVNPPKELTKQELNNLEPIKDHQPRFEKGRYTEGIYIALAKRINKGIYGGFYKTPASPLPFHCAPFIKHMIDWKNAFENLVKIGKKDDFLSMLDSIEIDLNIKESASLYKSFFDEMTKPEIIKFAREQGIKVNSKDRKAEIIEKVFNK